MRIFITGATGFIGSFLVAELIGAGHKVIGLSRSSAGAQMLAEAGAEIVRGDVNDLDNLRTAAKTADAVIHTAFNHDFANVKAHSEQDRKVIETLGEAVSGRPFIVTSGTGLIGSKSGNVATEADDPAPSSQVPRAATEEAARAVMEKGGHAMLMRLPQVHDTRRQGRISLHILLARKKGFVAYIGDGANRLPAVHVSDAVRLYRLALEHGTAGARYHAVADEGVAMRDIAEAIGKGLNMPVVALSPEEAPGYFGSMASLAAIDLAASSARTREQLGWRPMGPDLLSDLRAMNYGEV